RSATLAGRGPSVARRRWGAVTEPEDRGAARARPVRAARAGKEVFVNPPEARPVEPQDAVVVSAVVDAGADPRAAGPPSAGPPSACTLCGGPARLCGGVRRCTYLPGSPRELRWLTAIRAVYVGLVLTRTPAALWGGALLRFGRRLTTSDGAP